MHYLSYLRRAFFAVVLVFGFLLVGSFFKSVNACGLTSATLVGTSPGFTCDENSISFSYRFVAGWGCFNADYLDIRAAAFVNGTEVGAYGSPGDVGLACGCWTDQPEAKTVNITIPFNTPLSDPQAGINVRLYYRTEPSAQYTYVEVLNNTAAACGVQPKLIDGSYCTSGTQCIGNICYQNSCASCYPPATMVGAANCSKCCGASPEGIAACAVSGLCPASISCSMPNASCQISGRCCVTGNSCSKLPYEDEKTCHPPSSQSCIQKGVVCDPSGNHGTCCNSLPCQDNPVTPNNDPVCYTDAIWSTPPTMRYTGKIVGMEELLKIIYKIAVPAAVIISLLIIVRSGYAIMTSEGIPQKVAEAKEDLLSAIMGVAFIMLSSVILRVIITSLIGNF